MTRDEDAWRSANVSPPSSRPWLTRFRSFLHLQSEGASLRASPFTSAALSWPSLILFTSKATLHWLLGQSLVPSVSRSGDYGSYVVFNMAYGRLLVYMIMAFFLAVFATILACRRPTGPQPAAWGHVQTLANLIDEWEVGWDGRLWWGDKGCGKDGVRHAGTSGDKGRLGKIMLGTVYS